MMDSGFLIRSILMQVVVFSAVPFLFWALRRRKAVSFFSFVGLCKPQRSAGLKQILLFMALYIAVYGVVHLTPIAALTQPSASAYAGLGAAAVIPAFFVAFIQQALAEEILFRGFIGKRLIARLGITPGNLIQAFIFGAVHVLFSASPGKSLAACLIIFASTSAGGWLLGFLDEKLCNGSIFPSILLHGLGNFIMVLSVAF